MAPPLFKTQKKLKVENNNWEPVVGQKIIALKTKGNQLGNQIIKDDVYTVSQRIQFDGCGTWFVDIGMRCDSLGLGMCECGKFVPAHILGDIVWVFIGFFAPYNPYSNSVSHELAEKAMEVKPEVDVAVKREVVNN